jgi:DNA replication protein DnaC
LFQVITERAEKAAIIITTNLGFSEWSTVVPNARLGTVTLMGKMPLAD